MPGLTKKLVFFLVVLILGYVGWRGYQYFFDKTFPQIEIIGLTDGDCVGGDISCVIKGHDKYKVNSLAVWLDNKDFIVEERVGKSFCERPFKLSTSDLSNEAHVLKVRMIDGTYRGNVSIKECKFTVDNMPLQGAFLHPEVDYKVLQGRTFHLPFQCNKRIKKASVKILSKEFGVVPEADYGTVYECFVPVDCEEFPGEQAFVIECEDFVGNQLKLNGKIQITPFPFKKQVIRGVNEEVFAEERRLGRSEHDLSNLLQEIATNSPSEKLWRGPFLVPLNLTAITCDFGVKRISQERGCYRHAALDVIGLPKTVVWAPQDGFVRIKDRFEVTGNTVVIDHGCGVVSILCHLDKFSDINVGDRIKRGNPVGIMGRTGYATGDHLHWEMRVNNVSVDPIQWTKRDF